jgi:hypothetical protein
MSREPMDTGPLDIRAVRGHFVFPELGRGRHEQRGEHSATA